MKDLSPEARAVVDVGRHPGVFTPVDRDRIRRDLQVRLATLGTVTTTAGSAAAMSMSMTAKMALVAVVTTVLGGGLASFWVLRGRDPGLGTAAPVSSSPEPAAVAMPGVAAIPAAEDITTDLRLPSDSGPAAEVKRAGKRPLAAGVTATEERGAPPLDSELSLLKQARQDLRTGSPGSAYQRLADYDRRYGRGPLWQERQALAAIAFCQWRPGPQSQARAAEFLRNSPQSPLADRVRSVCSGVNAAAE